MRREMRQTIAESKDSTTRGMTDLDARISHLKNRMNDNEEKLEARVATVRKVIFMISVYFNLGFEHNLYICT